MYRKSQLHKHGGWKYHKRFRSTSARKNIGSKSDDKRLYEHQKIREDVKKMQLQWFSFTTDANGPWHEGGKARTLTA